MSQDRSIVAVVAHPGDNLAESCLSQFKSRGVRAVAVPPDASGERRLALDATDCFLDGRPVAGVFFRTTSAAHFSAGFCEEDQDFANSEFGSIWLAASNLPAVKAINRLDAALWYDGARWFALRTRLHRAGVSSATICFGGGANQGERWLPFSGERLETATHEIAHRALGSAMTTAKPGGHTLFVGGDIIEGETGPSFTRLGRTLLNQGLSIARAIFDQEGALFRVEALPVIENPAVCERTAERIVEVFHEHLHSR